MNEENLVKWLRGFRCTLEQWFAVVMAVWVCGAAPSVWVLKLAAGLFVIHRHFAFYEITERKKLAWNPKTWGGVGFYLLILLAANP